MSAKSTSAATRDHDARERFERTRLRLRKLLAFDVAALAITDRAAGKTQVFIHHGHHGRDFIEHKVLEQSLEGEFRLVAGQLVAVSRSELARDVSFVEHVFGVETRALKSGLLLPLPDSNDAPAMLFLGSYSEALLQARKKLTLADVHLALAEPGEAGAAEASPTLGGGDQLQAPHGDSYRLCFDGIDLPVALVASDLTILEVNPAFEKVFGYSGQHVVNQRSLKDFLATSERRALFRPRDQRARLQFEARLVLRSGLERTFEVTLLRSPGADSRIATFRDLTAIRESTADLREWAERLSVIHGIGEAVNAATSIKEIFVRSVKQLRRISHFEYAALAFAHTATQQVRLEACFKRGRFATGRSVMPIDSFARLVGAPSGVLETLAEPLAAFLGAPGHKSILAVLLPGERHGTLPPASTVLQRSVVKAAAGASKRNTAARPGSAPTGCLVLASPYPDAFSSYHLQVLESIGGLLAAGIRKVQLLRETQQNYDRLATLSEVSRSIGQSLNLAHVLQAIARAAKKALAVPAASICLLEQQALPHGAVAVAGAVDCKECTPRLNPALIRRLERNRPILLPDLRRSKLFGEKAKELLARNDLSAYLGAPILIDGRPAALLNVFAADATRFHSGGEEMLSALAAQAAHVLQNARLFEQEKQTKDYLENLLKSSVDAIVSTDRCGRLTYFSQGAESMCGQLAAAVIGRPVAEFLCRGPSEARQLLRRVMRERKIQSYESDVLHADRGTISVSLSISQILADDGRVTGFLVIGKDISRRRAAEQESKRRGEELENFVYLISHNLKAPLVSIQGFANLLQDEVGSSLKKEHAHFIQRILKNAVAMENMIVDLLDFSRMGHAQLKLGGTNVAELVKNVVDEMKLFEYARDVEFHIAPDLPVVMADAEGLNIVFQNLLGNAIKYRRPDVPSQIKVGWELQPRCYAFWVQDNGIGMDPNFQGKAFGLFQRGANTNHISGTGVGLALVKRIIENHRGQVRLESTPQAGTTVHFTIPKVEREDR